ncbi:1567_t:CDS:2, partial [Gigaspora margarita]
SLDFAVGVAVVGGKLSPLVSSLLVKIRRCVGIVYGEIRRWCHFWNFAVNVAIASGKFRHVAVAGSKALQVAELVIGA